MSNYSANNYSKTETNTPWYKLFQHIPEGARVLDFGCSSGNLGAELKKAKKCTVIGVDIDKDDVRLASRKLDATFVKNIETDDFTELGKFDAIIFADVLEHLINPSGTLRTIKKLLEPSGKILFSIPNMAHMSTRLMLLTGKFGYGETGLLDKTHLHFYDETEVRRIFNDAKLVIDNLDWTEYYVLEKELKSKLAEVGLKPTSKFLNSSKRVDAVALQYVGTAVPNRKGSKKVELPGVSPWVQKADEYVDLYEQRMQNRIDLLQQELDAVKADRDNLLKSTSWKVTKPIREAKRLVKGRR